MRPVIIHPLSSLTLFSWSLALHPRIYPDLPWQEGRSAGRYRLSVTHVITVSPISFSPGSHVMFNCSPGFVNPCTFPKRIVGGGQLPAVKELELPNSAKPLEFHCNLRLQTGGGADRVSPVIQKTFLLALLIYPLSQLGVRMFHFSWFILHNKRW